MVTGVTNHAHLPDHRRLWYRGSSKVPRRLLRASLPSFLPPTSPASRRKLFRGFVAVLLAPADFLSRWSDGLELAAWFVA